MTLVYDLRLWFIALYAFGLAVFLAGVFRFRPRREAIEEKHGPLPTPGALITFLVPPIILLARVGHYPAEWLPVRLVGVALSLYAIVMLPWATWTLGRMYVPGTGVFRDHKLVTAGPFRFVRHPIYSAIITLWLGAALGTLNWLLLMTWPVYVVGVMKPARAEEELLRAKFGEAYEEYAEETGGFIPRLWRAPAGQPEQRTQA
ncbi:MAG: isoprenylcysteine carboxylmethyltransferase family protein [Candidatus Promineifilaceae bacterium]|nr:isoprenylcysteine carboxylmethyltransferase family protein [Candidatus Promineifilaceae bacterium]